MEARGSPAASRSSAMNGNNPKMTMPSTNTAPKQTFRSEEHTSELQSRSDLVCRLLLEKKKRKITNADLQHLLIQPDSPDSTKVASIRILCPNGAVHPPKRFRCTSKGVAEPTETDVSS